jgi:threonine/homoserine/homoserine lactone efflux protein
MSLEIFAALIVFAFVTSITPGPNNLMLLASGVNFGFRRTVPHMLGVGFGFLVLLLCVGLGLGAIIARFPIVHVGLKIGGTLYILYLAWRLATSRSIGDGRSSGRPMTFLEAVAFQWVNPKAWVMAIAAMAAYTDPDSYVLSVLIVGLTFAAVGVPSVSAWAGFGMALRSWLADPLRLKWFNMVTGALLVLSLWPMLRVA